MNRKLVLILFFSVSVFLICSPETSARSKTINLRNFTLRLSETNVKQGHTTTVFLDSKHALKSLKFTSLGRKYQYFKLLNSNRPHLFRTFISIPALTKPGVHYIYITAVNVYGKKSNLYLKYRVIDAEFPTQFINLPKKKRSMVTSKALVKESNIIGRLFRAEYLRRYSVSTFIQPVQGIISSVFGAQRKYNSNRVAWYHKGIDIAAARGTPVRAANSGKIILAENFKIHGNTVMIDHGYSVKTIYTHMQKISKHKGEHVQRGEIIGYIGDTGISTGPHLHFGLSINNVRVNPMQWIDNRVSLLY